MDFSLSASDRQRVSTLREWGREYFRPAGLRADRNGQALPVDDPFFRTALELGYGRSTWAPPASQPAPHPVRTQSAVLNVILAEESSYWDRGIGVAMPGPGLGEAPILIMGTEEQKQRFLEPFVAPDKPMWGAFAMTEPSGGSDVANIKTRAHRDGDHWVLNGAKAFSGNAGRAEWIVVFATVDPKLGRAGHRAFVVPRDTPGLVGFRHEKKMGLKAYESTSFFLEDCRVPAENLLGGESYYAQRTGFKGAMQTFNSGRPAIAGMAVGIGRAALDEILAHVRESGLQNDTRIRDRIDTARRKLKAAYLVALKAAWMADQKQANLVEASMAKALAPVAALEATQLGMDVLGMTGAQGGTLIEKLYRDVKAMDIVEGTGQIQRVVMARQLVQLPN